MLPSAWRVVSRSRIADVIRHVTGFSTTSHNNSESNVLEIVNMYVENAHALALDKLMEQKDAPGQKPMRGEDKRRHIEGISLFENKIPVIYAQILVRMNYEYFE